jgi:hypothetical protein
MIALAAITVTFGIPSKSSCGAALSFGRSSTAYRLEPTGDLSDQGRSSGSGSRLSKLERTTCGERGMMAPSPLAGAFSFGINRELRADGLLDD